MGQATSLYLNLPTRSLHHARFHMLRNRNLDKRHTITFEFTGHTSGQPQNVARFCGEFCGHASSWKEAADLLEVLEALRWGLHLNRSVGT